MRTSLSAVLRSALLNVLLLGSYADRKPGLSGANYVGEKLPFSVSNSQLLREQVQRHRHRTATSPGEAQQTLSARTFSLHRLAACAAAGSKIGFRSIAHYTLQ